VSWSRAGQVLDVRLHVKAALIPGAFRAFGGVGTVPASFLYPLVDRLLDTPKNQRSRGSFLEGGGGVRAHCSVLRARFFDETSKEARHGSGA
jgi:hypothetical protein